MKKHLLLVALIILLFSCNNLKSNKSSQIEAEDLVGIWTEHWGVDSSDTDVDYVDTLSFNLNDVGQLTIYCINNSDFIYRDIELDNTGLSFQMENTVDPNEEFLIDYTLMLTNKDLFDGGIVNSRGKKVKIQLRRLP